MMERQWISVSISFITISVCERFFLFFFFIFSCRKAVSNREFGVFFFSGNCNGNYGMFGLMCPKTGYATHPTCCNVDGKTVNVQGCKCGDTSCSSDQLCTASTSTCAYPVCSNTDGSKIIGDMKGGKCQCGKYECVAGQKCDAATDTSSACEYPVCSTVDGSAVATNAKCKCGTYAICDEGDTCTGKQRMIDVFGTIMLTFFSFFFSSFSQKLIQITLMILVRANQKVQQLHQLLRKSSLNAKLM